MSYERPALVAAGFLGLLLGATLAAPNLTNHDPTRQYDPAATRLLPPGSVRYEIQLGDGRHLLGERPTSTAEGLSLMRRGRQLTLDRRTLAPRAAIRRRVFVFGTDHLGRDCFARVLYGGRLSLSVGLVAALASALVGSALGALANFNPGIADSALMRLTDCALAFPPLVVLLLLLSIFENGPAATLLFLAFVGWMPFARIVRAELRSLRNSGFAKAAVALGQTRTGILLLHLFPHLAPPLLVAVTLRFADVILLESALAFLGLGIPPPAPSWGRMIAEGSSRLETAWWISLLPGAVLFATVIAVNVVGDALARRLEPARAVGESARC